jgi:transposase
MVTTTTSLDDLRTQLAAMLAEGRGDDVLDIVITLVASMRDKNTALAMDVARLLRQRVGRTSEKVDAAQLSLLLGMLEAPAGADGAAAEPPAATLPRPKTKPAKEGHGRRPLPPHLERQEIVHAVPAGERACPTCGAERTCIGHERSEVLEFVPATFKVEVHIREKLACRACEGAVATAPAADKVIERGLPGPGLVAHVVVSKYQDHCPLHRLRRIYLREGVDLAVSTLAGWVEAGHDALHPLAERIRALARTAYLVQADDTGLKVLDKDSPGGSKRGHLWCYVGDEKLVAIVYTPSWRKEGPQGFLADRKGYVQADAYKGYDGLFAREGATAVEVGCWAHARRYYYETLQMGDVRAAVPMKFIQDLYAVEARAKELGLDPQARKELRQAESMPILLQLGRWLADTYNAEPPKSPLAKAAGYSVRQWEALKRYTEDGRLPIDNTGCERALRGIAVGRKNYLFAGSDGGAERAATMYTILGTCALAGVEPLAYVRDVIIKLQGGWPAARIDELLPAHWATARAARTEAPAPAPTAPSPA